MQIPAPAPHRLDPAALDSVSGGAVTLSGTAGDDMACIPEALSGLMGGAGRDTLLGGAGADTFDGGADPMSPQLDGRGDRWDGEAGNDVFILRSTPGEGRDVQLPFPLPAITGIERLVFR